MIYPSKPLKNPRPRVGVMPPEVYLIEALAEGCYTIDYQTIYDDEISSADRYKVNVKK